MVRRLDLALALCLLCLTSVFQGGSCRSVLRGAPFVSGIFTNANGAGGLFYCISAGGNPRTPVPPSGRQATIETCDATSGSPMLLKWQSNTLQPSDPAWAGSCLTAVQVTKTVKGQPVSSWQAWFKPCGDNNQGWFMDQIGRLWSVTIPGVVLDSASATANDNYVKSGDKLILRSATLQAAAGSQSWIYQPSGLVDGYQGLIVSQMLDTSAGTVGQPLCLDTMGSMQGKVINVGFRPCNLPAVGIRTWKSQNVEVEVVRLGSIFLDYIKLTAANATTTKWPAGNFRLQPVDPNTGKVLQVAGKDQCLFFGCNMRNCSVSAGEGTAVAGKGDPNFQMTVKNCLAYYARATAATTKVYLPGPGDVVSYSNHGNVMGFFGTRSNNNTICMRNIDRVAIEDSCSFRTVSNNFFFISTALPPSPL